MTTLRNLKLLAVSATATTLVGVVVAVPIQNPVTTAPDNTLINQAAEWVPLMYEYQHKINGAVRYIYTEYRWSDGSTRRERHDGREISITNRASGAFFHLNGGRWTQHPMRRQPNEGKPFLKLRRDKVTSVAPSDPRVQLIVASVALPVTFHEMRTPGPGGSTTSTIFCPELNMLEVWSQRRRDEGVVERELTLISVGEPSAALFPPHGADVTVSSEPSGPGSVLAPPPRQ